MQATCEISMYSLSNDYKQHIIDFILKLRTHKNILIETNGLSTQLIGDYDVILDLLRGEMKDVLENGKAVFVLKLAQGELTKEDLPVELK